MFNHSFVMQFCDLSIFFFFVAVFLGCTSTGRVGLCFLWFFVQELPKAQPAGFLFFFNPLYCIIIKKKHQIKFKVYEY